MNGYSFKRFELTVLHISLYKNYNVYVHNETRQSLCNAQLEPLSVDSSASACSDLLLKLSECFPIALIALLSLLGTKPKKAQLL